MGSVNASRRLVETAWLDTCTTWFVEVLYRLIVLRGCVMFSCQALKMEDTGYGTVMIAAILSEEPAMITDVGDCVLGHIRDKHEVIHCSPTTA